MKSIDSLSESINESRAPHGARGLKYFIFLLGCAPLVSRPARGAWIEIFPVCF